MGLIADIVVAIFIIINLIVCTHRGFIRCVMSSVSSILAFAVAILASGPLAALLENKFGWETAIAKWNVPFISAQTLLRILVGIGIFVVVRLLCVILDKILQAIKKKLKAVGVLDRILGTVFGGFFALAELTFIFMLVDHLGWAETLQLTEQAGGYFAYRLYDFCREHLFELFEFLTSTASAMTPKF